MKKLLFIAVIVVLSSLSVISISYGQELSKTIIREGITYTLADRPLYIDPVYNGSTDPMVCYNYNTNRWYMYYTSRRSNVPGLRGTESVHGSPIGIAASEDGGATWKYIGNCNIDYHPDKDPTYWAPK